ncbi:MAG: tetraacyldisaccharide 4'-kinase [Fusobacteriota bacterium]
MLILSWIYKFITGLRNILYKKGILKTKNIKNIKIICIGNITVGGTGKTPAVQYFAKKYIDEGKKVAIISRGYKGKRKKDPMIVSDGNNILGKVSEVGDEPFLHASNLSVPVIVGRDRYSAVMLAQKRFDIDTIILDDGFQHQKLERDKNIVLISALDPFGDFKLLPKGRLREPIDGLERANEFIITKSDLVSKEKLSNITKYLKHYNKNISLAIHKPSKLFSFTGEERELDFIKGKDILLLSGISNPKSFEDTVRKFKPGIINRIDYPDHYKFKKEDIKSAITGQKRAKCDIILITEKDYVKIYELIRKADIPLENIFVLRIRFEIQK